MTQVAVLGSGSWGTTFAVVLADAGAKVRLWGRNTQVCAEITERHTNSRYLGDTPLPESIEASTDAAGVLDGADVVVLAVPSQTLRDNLAAWRPALPAGAVLVSLMKGVEATTHLRMSQVVGQVADVGPERVAVVSGPNLAKEIAVRQPTATVVATTRADVNGAVRRLLDVRKASFLPMDRAVEETGMEYGGITPLGVPAGWRVLVDARVPAVERVVVGSGVRHSKLVLPGAALTSLPGAVVVDGLARDV
jgi:glycerol-3-phosphate dehydrogenase (NAD(P)+)